MKFLVDAQLPRRLSIAIQLGGHDTIHRLDLPKGNRTSDSEVNEISITQQRIVITKDADFVNSFLLRDRPYKLLLISAGNITNMDLEQLFLPQLDNFVELFE